MRFILFLKKIKASWDRRRYFNTLLSSDKSFIKEFSSDNADSQPDYEDERTLTRILLLSHALEKGQMFTVKKDNWGKEKSIALCKYLNAYLIHNELNDICVNAINILRSFADDKTASKCALKDILTLYGTYREKLFFHDAGCIDLFEPKEFDKEAIRYFFESRHSIRDFSEEPITRDEIKACLKFASVTPTACNRQTSQVYAVRNKDLMKQILDNQKGDQGWCMNADTLFIITSNQTRFSSEMERYQSLIDGGLYAMNFDWALHYNHIASCFKMFVRLPELEIKVKNLCGIPDNEVPVVIIMAGHYKTETVKGLVSHRFEPQCVYLD